MILIQHIRIDSTKYDRGSKGGARRNAVPRTFPIRPPHENREGWLHAIVMASESDYVPVESWFPLPIEMHVAGMVVHPHGDAADVVIDPGSFFFFLKKPPRPHFAGKIARLPFGQRLTIRVNTAIDGDHQRLYHEHVVHIGYAEKLTLDLPLFREIDERAVLY